MGTMRTVDDILPTDVILATGLSCVETFRVQVLTLK